MFSSTTTSNGQYKMNNEKRGYLVIIDNHEFNKPKIYPDLIGSHHDVKNLIDTFVYGLDFELVLRQNQTKAQMIKLMKYFAQEVDHTNVDCFMAVFLSHGTTNDITNEQYICAIDEDVALTDLTEPFLSTQTLHQKPKMFFCDVCRGNKKEPPDAKSMSSLSLKDGEDGEEVKATSLKYKFEPMSGTIEQTFNAQKEFLYGYGSCHGHVAGKSFLSFSMFLLIIFKIRKRISLFEIKS